MYQERERGVGGREGGRKRERNEVHTLIGSYHTYFILGEELLYNPP